MGHLDRKHGSDHGGGGARPARHLHPDTGAALVALDACRPLAWLGLQVAGAGAGLVLASRAVVWASQAPSFWVPLFFEPMGWMLVVAGGAILLVGVIVACICYFRGGSSAKKRSSRSRNLSRSASRASTGSTRS